MGTPSNLIVGALSVSVSQNKTLDSTSAGGGLTFTDLGFTEGGVSINDDVDIKEFFADQMFIPPAAFMGDINTEIKFNIAEPTIANLALVIPGGYNNSGTFQFGDPVNGVIKYYHLLLTMTSPNPNYSSLKYYFPRVTASGSSKLPLKKTEATLVPVTYMVLLPDRIESNMVTNGKLTGAATSWTLGSGWAYGTDNIEASTATGTISQTIATLIPGVYYTVEYSIASITGAGATITASVGGTAGTGRTTASASETNGVWTETIKCGARTTFALTPSGTVTTCVIDNIRIYPAYAANRVLLV